MANLPAAPDLRDYLPGIEADREIDDWGRSERVSGAFDRVVAEFLFHVWFRTDVEGVDHVPRSGPALLVANDSGALLADAAMIGKAVGEHHGRELRTLVDHGFKRVPGVGMLLTKLGAIPAHPANAQRLLHDEQSLALAFPEAGKPSDARYRVQRFDDDVIASALRAQAPIVPIAVVGAEEATPVFARLARLPAPLPAKLCIRFLAPVRTAALPHTDRALVRTIAHELRATIQEELHDMLGQRRSAWLG